KTLPRMRGREGPVPKAREGGGSVATLISATGSAEARQQPHQAAGVRREQGRRVEIAGGAFAGLAAGRIRHDKIGEGAELELLRDRQCPGQDQITGRRAEDRRTEDTAVAAGDDLDLAGGVALGLSAVVL